MTNAFHPSRRTVLTGSLASASVLSVHGRAFAQAMDHMDMGGTQNQCQAAGPATVEPVSGPPRNLTIAWNEASICTAAVPVAKEKGFFKKYNLNIDYVNFAGATDQLLEALSTGKADGAPGMALRWLKPLQQGFDVKLVAGLHAGCMYLMTAPSTGIKTLTDLKGKTVGVTDIGGPDRNFFSIRLKEAGLDPETDVQWRQFPADLLPLALQRGDVQAISDADPFSYPQRRQFGLLDIDNNMKGEWAHLTCCVIGLRGSLIRNEPKVAAAVTRAIMEAGAWLACNPEEAATIFQPYAPKANIKDLAAMLQMQGHHHQTLTGDFRQEIARYADALKQIGVFRPSLDTERYAQRVTQDLFSG
ncbi:ABC transporter substrate-binding protein [Gluconobacter frateurii]|uniref:Nitrate transport protein NrtA n=1 Tax=Gluconobacter frateurii NRIC 0228 TaxID=1307946 RepID=A0ABQ0QF62_9PROT|nr:ABC transporter substrate-binding protein [Gluconobacter frateurii]GBR16742.1 putative nitrate transport protein NrtA [Gluconobacter frateurii NRIC 0228]GLP90652.1 ABC transporter substrate-binding protein [Gluconobacter frateurii]